MQQIKNINQGKAIQDIYKKYLKVCADAVKKEKVFQSFKSNPAFREVLEHCSRRLGENHLNQIKANNPDLLNNKKVFENDSVGNPIRETYAELTCSPTTLQYLNVVSNLIMKYKSLNGWNIVEIGGGYGGQCKIIADVFDVNAFMLFDLEAPSDLQNKYLSHFGIENAMSDFVPPLTDENKYDLVISNYALSEMPRDIQLDYVKKICLQSKHGYLTCNDRIEGTELIEKKFKVTRENDIEGERKTNFILSW